jgi:hypothetical protein
VIQVEEWSLAGQPRNAATAPAAPPVDDDMVPF